MLLAPGDDIGPYVVEGILGQGALSTVYAVRHRDLGIRRALKLLGSLRPDLAGRFMEEGRIQARLDHPNLVRVHDVIRIGGTLALVLDLVPGDTLDVWVGVGRPWAEVEPVFRAICNGVGFAHAAGLVHRDLKPQNVLILRDGVVPKVTDFGIARRMDGTGGTSHGSLLGTPRYMAPEQMRDSSAVDARADVWALGCLLHEMLMGKPPFDGSDLIALHAAMLSGTRPRTEGPAVAVAAVDAALVADPGRRLRDVAGLLAILDGAVPEAAPIASTWADVQPSDRYLVDETIEERGGLSRLRVRDRVTGRLLAAKRLRVAENPGLLERMRREERILREGGEGLAPLVDAFSVGTGDDRAFWLVREAIGDAPRPGSIEPLEGVLALLARLHAREPAIVVRDLAPSRWEVGPHGWVLVDLAGVREEPTGEMTATFAGEFGFAAPETWSGEATPASDVFGAGMLAIWLSTGLEPRKLIRADGTVAWDRSGDSGTVAWIGALIRPAPASRPTATAALASLRRLLRPPVAAPAPTDIPAPKLAFAEPEPVDEPDFAEPPVLYVPSPPTVTRQTALIAAGTVGVPIGLILGLIVLIRWVTAPTLLVPHEYPDPTVLLPGAAQAWAESADVRACIEDFVARHPETVNPRVDVDVRATPDMPVVIDALPGKFLADPLTACLDAAESAGPHPVLDVAGPRTIRWNLDLK